MFEEFSSEAFLSARPEERHSLCLRLAETLSQRFRGSGDWTKTAYEVVEALRDVGHDLWSFDDNSPEYQIWGGDYEKPEKSRGELILDFHSPSSVSVRFAIGGHASGAESGSAED